jgi:aryl-alcohol dehydrogenase-like predicted oxidoreductase
VRIARLGDTDLDVFPLCLGGNVFGWTLDEPGSFAVLDAYREGGGNFIDTADSYGRRGAGEGSSEELIGRWMAARGNRDELVLATKVGVSTTRRGLSAETIAAACEESLRRLGTDRIDVYYAHQDDLDTPLDETLVAFATLIAQGKIRYAAASNYSPERLEQALELGRQAELAGFVALQAQYNLMERGYERELAPICAAHDVACLPYFGLAMGFLTGKYRPGGGEIDSPRAARVVESYLNERGIRVLEALDEIAAAHEVSVAAVALAWLAAQPTVATPIASARSAEQLAELLQFVDLELDAGEIERLSAASA